MLNKFQQKALCFVTAIKNVYLEEEERESYPALEFSENEITDDFTAILVAMRIWYEQLMEDEQDLVGFTHILNRLAIQYTTKPIEENEQLCGS